MVKCRFCGSISLHPVLDLERNQLSDACRVAESVSGPSLECRYRAYRVRQGEPGATHREHPNGLALTSIDRPPGSRKLSGWDAHESHCLALFGELQT